MDILKPLFIKDSSLRLHSKCDRNLRATLKVVVKARLTFLSQSTVYLTTIVTRFFDENDIFILLESSIPALQDGYGIFDVRKL